MTQGNRRVSTPSTRVRQSEHVVDVRRIRGFSSKSKLVSPTPLRTFCLLQNHRQWERGAFHVASMDEGKQIRSLLTRRCTERSRPAAQRKEKKKKKKKPKKEATKGARFGERGKFEKIKEGPGEREAPILSSDKVNRNVLTRTLHEYVRKNNIRLFGCFILRYSAVSQQSFILQLYCLVLFYIPSVYNQSFLLQITTKTQI